MQTPYVLLLEDDFLWDKSVLQDFIQVMQLHPYLDVVGGRAGLHFAGFMKVQNQTLFLVKVPLLFISSTLLKGFLFIENCTVGIFSNYWSVITSSCLSIFLIHQIILELFQGEHGLLEGTDVINGVKGKACGIVDFVPNFFLARTETLMNLQWHNELKV